MSTEQGTMGGESINVNRQRRIITVTAEKKTPESPTTPALYSDNSDLPIRSMFSGRGDPFFFFDFLTF
jgi:hypothetical protein